MMNFICDEEDRIVIFSFCVLVNADLCDDVTDHGIRK
jgi:hypothetical protein